MGDIHLRFGTPERLGSDVQELPKALHRSYNTFMSGMVVSESDILSAASMLKLEVAVLTNAFRKLEIPICRLARPLDEPSACCTETWFNMCSWLHHFAGGLGELCEPLGNMLVPEGVLDGNESSYEDDEVAVDDSSEGSQQD